MKFQYESPQTDKENLSEKSIEAELKSGIKYIPHECPLCGNPASVAITGLSFCRNEDCVIYGWRF